MLGATVDHQTTGMIDQRHTQPWSVTEEFSDMLVWDAIMDHCRSVHWQYHMPGCIVVMQCQAYEHQNIPSLTVQQTEAKLFLSSLSMPVILLTLCGADV